MIGMLLLESQETAFLEQSRHLLVVSLSWLSFQAHLPKSVTRGLGIIEMIQRFVNEVHYDGHRCQVKRLSLPTLDVPNDL